MKKYQLPEKFEDLVTNQEALDILYQEFSPLKNNRLSEVLDIEIEYEDKVYVLKYTDEKVIIKKGFSRKTPFCAISFDDHFWNDLNTFFEDALDGSANLIFLQQFCEKIKNYKKRDIENIFKAFDNLDNYKFKLLLADGHLTVAKPSIDEASREIVIHAEINDLLAMNLNNLSLSSFKLKGDLRLQTEVVPLLSLFNI